MHDLSTNQRRRARKELPPQEDVGFFCFAAPELRKQPTTNAREHFQTFLLPALGNENQSNQSAPYPSWLLVPTFLLLRSVPWVLQPQPSNLQLFNYGGCWQTQRIASMQVEDGATEPREEKRNEGATQQYRKANRARVNVTDKDTKSKWTQKKERATDWNIFLKVELARRKIKIFKLCGLDRQASQKQF